MAPVLETVPTAIRIARADFLQRTRSRRFLLVLAIVAYVGHQLNVGTFELLYQDTVDGATVDYRGEPTAPYVGLTTGLTGATFLLFFGYYVLASSLERDRSTGFDELLASTPVSDRTYLLGKWLSHVGVVAAVLATLAAAALVNHAVHGVGSTDPVWIVGAVFLVGFPIGCFVAGVTLVFQSTDRLRGTAGNVTYFFGAVALLSLVAAAFAGDDGATSSIPVWIRAVDSIGLVAAGEMTFDALLAVAPDYDGPPVANYGTGTIDGEVVTYEWNGGSWPAWFYANRLGLALAGAGLALAATLPYDRYAPRDESPGRTFGDRLGRFVPSVLSREDADGSDATDPADVSLTPVTDRSAGGFGRLFVQELKLLTRGHARWWYIGAAVIAIIGLTSAAPPEAIVSAAAIWPLFVWSGMGYRSVAHRMTPFIVSSKQPYRQLLAEWAAGAAVTAAFLGVAIWPTVLEAGLEGLLVIVGAVLFVPSVAQAFGLWSRTRRVFELGYLALWYAGPLNGVAPIDFAGATTETVGTATPLLFGAVGLVALGTALGHRYLRT
ncbi:ABC transporter permease [Haloterrigena salinisoli]|uniref:ABC transporter permease n=1 Tax=Haloterrigena salinisoli TaxID=3132747 RepID=UPI0030CE1139